MKLFAGLIALAGLTAPAMEVMAQHSVAEANLTQERRPVTRGVNSGRDIYICGNFYCYADGSRVPDLDTIWGGPR